MSAERITLILSNADEVQRLIGEQLYYGRLPTSARYPAVQFRLSGGRPITHLRGESQLQNPEYQFDVYAMTMAQAEEISEAVRRALNAENDVDFSALPLGLPSANYADDRSVYRLSFGYSVWTH